MMLTTEFVLMLILGICLGLVLAYIMHICCSSAPPTEAAQQSGITAEPEGARQTLLLPPTAEISHDSSPQQTND